LLESVDTVIVIPNEKLLAVAKDAGFFESFRIADDVLRQGVQGISDIITIPGVINRDFADVKTTMAGMGYAVMGTAMRAGSNRAVEAAMAAMASPLLEAGAIDGARGILINITGSSNLKLSEVNEASGIIQSAAHEDANIIFGAVLDESMGDDVKITVIATGFKHQEMPQRRERMLAESTLPTARYDVPIRPRMDVPKTEAPRAEVPRFASETDVAEVRLVSAIPEAKAPVAEYAEPEVDKEEHQTIAVGAEPELIPVKASVFDDDFFRATPRVPESGEAAISEPQTTWPSRPLAHTNVQQELIPAETAPSRVEPMVETVSRGELVCGQPDAGRCDGWRRSGGAAAAIEALGNMNGTAVAIDPSTGRILAMVNQKLALSSGAEPCSTIKLSVALAALEEGLVTKDTPVNLGGHYT
jgi:cell division protein FtsZ